MFTTSTVSSGNPAERIKKLISLALTRDLALLDVPRDIRERIARRSADVGCEVIWRKGPVRLMPAARTAILGTRKGGKDMPSGTVWLTDCVGDAKGRMERAWWAPPGGIYACLAVSPLLLPERWSFYSLGVGVAIAQVLREWGVQASVRWINDVLVSGKKVAGVLTEAVRTGEAGGDFLLFGMGVNVNIAAFPPHLPEATSLSVATGNEWPLDALSSHIIARVGIMFGLLHEWEARLLAEEASTRDNPVLAAWCLVSDSLYRDVIYGYDADLAPEFTARSVGIAGDGALILVTNEGEELRVNSGEIRYPGPGPRDTPL